MKRIYIDCYRIISIMILVMSMAIVTNAHPNVNDFRSHVALVPDIAQAFSPTPIPANIPRNTPLPVVDTIATPTFTPTATQQQFVTLSVRSDIQDSVNVRAEPDPESAIVGTINSEESYPVTGQYFLWFRLRYDGSPSGQAWIFSELVTISGDISLVPDLSTEPEVTTDPIIVGATQTWEIITLTPGGDLTATASSRILDDPVNVIEADINSPAGGNSGLPTFTPPPNTNLSSNNMTELNQPNRVSSEQTTLPPILPIMILGGLGLFGFVLSAIRK